MVIALARAPADDCADEKFGTTMAMDTRIDQPGPVTVFGGATIDHIAATANEPVMGASNPGVARHHTGRRRLQYRDRSWRGLAIRCVW